MKPGMNQTHSPSKFQWLPNACIGRYLCSSLAEIYYRLASGNKEESAPCVHPGLSEIPGGYEESPRTHDRNYLLYIRSVMINSAAVIQMKKAKGRFSSLNLPSLSNTVSEAWGIIVQRWLNFNQFQEFIWLFSSWHKCLSRKWQDSSNVGRGYSSSSN